MLLFQQPPAKSDTLRELVKRGAAAVPQLIAHLDDKRPTKITIKHEGVFGGMFFDDEYDYNSRTNKKPPDGVNRDFGNNDLRPNEHTVTVGDLCFVALGQIVNRHFSAVRYQPTACIMINSPTYSERLRIAVKSEWGKLTPLQHKESLIRDFLEPDSEFRRSEACLRLAYYYRDMLEPLALKHLAEPRYDEFEVQDLIREKLYRAKDSKERKAIFEAVAAKHNAVTRQGILKYLFEDLEMQENGEKGIVSPPVKPGEYLGRECLIELFSYPKTVKSTDRPFLMPLENSTQARFIDVLSYFPSPKLDEAVRIVLHSTDDIYLARACIRYLTGRGADTDIRKFVDARMPKADAKNRQEFQRLLDEIGWTPLHAATAAYENGKVEMHLQDGMAVNARSANGQTALHLAAEHGSYGALAILLKYKADPNIKDSQGRTPIQSAVGWNRQMVDELLAAKAEIPNVLVATVAGRADLVKRFVEADKAAVSARARTGDTALHLAAINGHTKVAEILLAHGADVNAIDGKSKLTPLHRAATYAPREFVALLLAHKADPNAKSWDGRTPKDFAVERRDNEIIRLFERQRRD